LQRRRLFKIYLINPWAAIKGRKEELKMEKHTCLGNSCWDSDCVDCYPLEHCVNHEHYFKEELDCNSCPNFTTCIRMLVHEETREWLESENYPKMRR
jgi:hypothetical protein